MSIRLSGRVRQVRPSPTVAITDLAARLRATGRDIISLSVGEPDFDTPQPVKNAAEAAIRAGDTKYTAVDGTDALKRSIIKKFRRDNGLDYGPEQILVSCGGKQSFFNLAQALLQPGDEVVIPAPYWVSFPDIVALAGATPVIVAAGADRRFKLEPDSLGAALTPRTRLLVLNSPCNPTGAVYTRTELEALGEVLRQHPDVVIASDDMYEKILWLDQGFHNIAMVCPDLAERTLVINGVSKAYAMTGWRIGYAAGPAPLIAAMKTIQSQSTTNPASISQAAAAAALDGDQAVVAQMCAEYRARHDLLLEALAPIDGISACPADGTFYLFPDFSGAIERLDGIEDDAALATFLLERAGVALVPGSAFGLPGHLRLACSASRPALVEAMRRIRQALA